MVRLKITIKTGRLELDKRHLRATMRAAGREVQQTAKRLIVTGGSGRTYRGSGGSSKYRGGWRKGPFRASAPGDPPASMTGTLRQSFKTIVFKSGEGVAVRDLAFYAKFLEAGARGGIGSGRGAVKGKRNKRAGVAGNRVLKPRPFLSRALEIKRASLAPRIGAAIEGGIKFVPEKRR